MSGAATAEVNGQPDESPEVQAPAFPVDNLADALPFLRRPFTSAAVKFKVQATWDGGALIVGYIDARLVIERLNMVVADQWEAEYEPTNGKLMWSHLTVCGVTRRDVGEGTGKGLVSDSLKRAGVPFGIGVSLYAMPKIRLRLQDGHIKEDKSRNGDTYKLTPNGETRCRAIYENWLDVVGRKAFGAPLDHGDAEDAVGDAETEAPAEDAPTPTPKLDAEFATRLRDGLRALKVTYKGINLLLGAVGADALPENSPVGVQHSLESLTKDQAVRFEARLEVMAKDAEAEASQDGGQS